jgi:23S rRNA (pseudouridine1915-N3)-methyltransferase
MKFILLNAASAHEQWCDQATSQYIEKIKHFIPIELVTLKTKKIARDSAEEKIKAEGKAILAAIQTEDLLVLFDEKGKNLNSIEFSKQMEKIFSSGKKKCIFLVGGAYGVSEEVKKRASLQLSLAPFVMNHLVAQVVCLEQIYRSLTIMRNLPYHNS